MSDPQAVLMSEPHADAVTSLPQAVLTSEPHADAVTSLPHAVLMSEPHADAVTSLPHAVLTSEPQAVAITFCAIFDEKNVSFSFHALNFMIFTLKFFNKSQKPLFYYDIYLDRYKNS